MGIRIRIRSTENGQHVFSHSHELYLSLRDVANARKSIPANLLVRFCTWSGRTELVDDNHAKFFKALGQRVKKLRNKSGFSQEDMISFGFSARHWQQIEAGRPITLTTLLRICAVFKVPVHSVVKGLDADFYTGSAAASGRPSRP